MNMLRCKSKNIWMNLSESSSFPRIAKQDVSAGAGKYFATFAETCSYFAVIKVFPFST